MTDKIRLQKLPPNSDYDSRWVWVAPDGSRYFVERASKSNEWSRTSTGTFMWVWIIRLQESENSYLILDTVNNLREAREYLSGS